VTVLVLFASSFMLVFLLGLQQFNVHHGRFTHAAVTSFLIGAANLAALKLAPDADALSVGAYLLGAHWAFWPA
jgi:hypothetical protein